MTTVEKTKSRGVLLAISAPLGVGKATLCQALLDRQPNARMVVSCTSRSAKPREVNGYDYIFMTHEEFKKKAGEGAFVEWVEIQGNFYGTSKNPMMADLEKGNDVILNVDVKGASAIKKALPEAVLVFVCPPTWQALLTRLRARYPEGQEDLIRRLTVAREELKLASIFDYVLFNDNLIESADGLSSILRSEKKRYTRGQEQLKRMVDDPISAA